MRTQIIIESLRCVGCVNFSETDSLYDVLLVNLGNFNRTPPNESSLTQRGREWIEFYIGV